MFSTIFAHSIVLLHFFNRYNFTLTFANSDLTPIILSTNIYTYNLTMRYKLKNLKIEMEWMGINSSNLAFKP